MARYWLKMVVFSCTSQELEGRCFMVTKLKWFSLVVGFMALSWISTNPVHAVDVGVGVGVGGGSNGHYEERTDTVLVEPAHEERRVTPARYETFTHSSGRVEERLIEPERVEVVVVPDRYETRTTRVWVEDRREPKVKLGFGIGF